MKVYRLLLLSCMLLLCGGLSAQQQSARAVLNRAAEAFRLAGGISAEFTMSTGAESHQAEGSISMLGQKFVLDAGGVKTWYNGRTQWSYVMANEEVSVSEPTAQELQGLNPYAWLTLNFDHYKLTLHQDAHQVYRIKIVPIHSNESFKAITLELNKKNYHPISIRVQQSINALDYTDIRIHHLQTNQQYKQEFFEFDAKQYPHVEVIDLR